LTLGLSQFSFDLFIKHQLPNIVFVIPQSQGFIPAESPIIAIAIENSLHLFVGKQLIGFGFYIVFWHFIHLLLLVLRLFFYISFSLYFVFIDSPSLLTECDSNY